MDSLVPLYDSEEEGSQSEPVQRHLVTSTTSTNSTREGDRIASTSRKRRKLPRLNDDLSAESNPVNTLPGAPIVKGEWLCHVFVEVPYIPALESIIKKSISECQKYLEQARPQSLSDTADRTNRLDSDSSSHSKQLKGSAADSKEESGSGSTRSHSAAEKTLGSRPSSKPQSGVTLSAISDSNSDADSLDAWIFHSVFHSEFQSNSSSSPTSNLACKPADAKGKFATASSGMNGTKRISDSAQYDGDPSTGEELSGSKSSSKKESTLKRKLQSGQDLPKSIPFESTGSMTSPSKLESTVSNPVSFIEAASGETGQEDDSNRPHISLSRPILILANEKQKFWDQISDAVKRSVAKRFDVSFSNFTHLINDYQSRDFLAVEVGMGWKELKLITQFVSQTLNSAFHSKPYYAEERFHSSLGFVSIPNLQDTDSSSSPRSWPLDKIAERLNEKLGQRLRDFKGFRVWRIGARIGKEVRWFELEV